MVTLITTLRTIPSSTVTRAAESRILTIWITCQVCYRVLVQQLKPSFSDDYIDYGDLIDDDEDITIEESQLNVTTAKSTVKIIKI